MKILNKSTRNLSVYEGNTEVLGKDSQGNILKGFGRGSRVLFVAHATLELEDEKYNLIKPEVAKLVKAGILEITVPAISTLSKDEIIAKVMLEAGVELKDKLTKAELQATALKLGVEL